MREAEFDVAVVGAGFGGVYAAYRFAAAGLSVMLAFGGKRNDGVNGDPAFQVYTDTGTLILAERYNNDVITAILTAEEMAAYQKSGAAALKKTKAPEVKEEKTAHTCIFKRIFHRRHHH